jgi:hypothetical protein
MAAWLVALLVGALLAALQYARRDGRTTTSVLPTALLRGAAATLIAALALDAPAGRARRPAPLVALDASASWLRGGDSAAWRAARDTAAAARSDSVFLFGDSLRPDDGTARGPMDHTSRVAPAVERALGVGRPLTVVTDGELADPEALGALPAGSRVVVVPRRTPVDAAVAGIEAPRAVVDGDTIEVRVTLSAGGAGAAAGALTLSLDGRPLARATTAPLAAYAERPVALRARIAAGRVGPALLQATVTTPGDAEPRNDTLSAGVQIARGAGAVFVSTAPNPDARFALTVLRGALSIPTRGYYRVAPGAWRAEGALTPVSETEVRTAIREAPIAILHGDTALFGAPRTITQGALALIVAPLPDDGEWYATGAPPSPLSSVLSGVPWDSLPPVDASAIEPRGDWAGLETRRGRSGERRVVIAGWERSRRVVVVSASGLSGWRARGGAPADAYAALWGGVFDWLAAGRGDLRGVVPDADLLREGDPVRWRRGNTPDSVVRVELTRRAPGAGRESLTVRFAPSTSVAETPPLARGVYDLTVPGGRAVLAINASSEWLPRPPRVRAGTIRGAPATTNAPSLRGLRWVYLIALALLCAEWLVRRRRGMR